MTTRDLASVSSLEDPVRRRLYDVVSSRPEAVGRDEAAALAGIGRPLAAYHLDKLVESGLLTVTYQRLGGRSGPGAGRPAKLYAKSDREFAVSVPPRDYELNLELTYVAQIVSGWTVQPVYTSIWHPSGTGIRYPDAQVVGVRSIVRY